VSVAVRAAQHLKSAGCELDQLASVKATVWFGPIPKSPARAVWVPEKAEASDRLCVDGIAV